MALVTRYFSTAAAGAGDGTTWADRAALFTGGAWSTVITGFNFAGSDSLLCLIGPGTHTITVALVSGLFANPPTVANPLFLHGCDSSGNKLTPTDLTWTSAQPVTWDSGLPVLATTTNVTTINQGAIALRLLSFTASGVTTNAVLGACGSAAWLSVYISSSNTSAKATTTTFVTAENMYVKMTGTSYQAAMVATGGAVLNNIRLEGNLSASSGNRQGLSIGGTSTVRRVTNITSFNHVGEPLIDTGTNTSQLLSIAKFVCYNSGAMKLNTTAAQTNSNTVVRGIVVGSTGWGIDGGVE